MRTNSRESQHQFTPEQIQNIKNRAKEDILKKVHDFIDTAGPGSYIESLNQGLHSFVKESLEEETDQMFILNHLFNYGLMTKLIADLNYFYSTYERFDYMDKMEEKE